MNHGFEKVECKDFKFPENSFFLNHPFYQNPNFNGIKKKLIIRALDNLSNLKNCKILIYNGPVSNKFRKGSQLNKVYELEKQYDYVMYKLVEKYSDIKYISFLNDDLIQDNMFYDPQHLCGEGALLFTKRLLSVINN